MPTLSAGWLSLVSLCHLHHLDFTITVIFVDIVDVNVTFTDRFRHGLPINMPDLDCVSLREDIQQNPDIRLGFVVYRLTYTDDAQ